MDGLAYSQGGVDVKIGLREIYLGWEFSFSSKNSRMFLFFLIMEFRNFLWVEQVIKNGELGELS